MTSLRSTKPVRRNAAPKLNLPRKIAVIFGTRPEAIKLAPVIREFQKHARVCCQLCITAQHRKLLDQVLEVFDLQPDTDLNLMRPGQSLSELTARAVTALDGYLEREQPDLVIVQGDTTTVLCATLAAFYRKIPVAHVEAGLRTWNLNAPWPEEANRVLTSRLARLHFAPTAGNRDNLLREQTPSKHIWITGNTVIDALLIARQRIRSQPPRINGLPDFLTPFATIKSSMSRPRTVLITCHRRENFGAGFRNILEAIGELARRFPEVHFIYPLHLNPNVRKPAEQTLGKTARRGQRSNLANIHLIEPLPYLEFVAAMDAAQLILTDSGGVQEEAPSLGKPVLVLRETTERPEAVTAGTVKLVGTHRERIIDEATKLLTDRAAYKAMAAKINPYGDGRASVRIVKQCLRFLDVADR